MLKILITLLIFQNLLFSAGLFDFFGGEGLSKKDNTSSYDVDINRDFVSNDNLITKRAKHTIELIPYVTFNLSELDHEEKELLDLSLNIGVSLNTAVNYIFNSNFGYMLHINYGKYNFDTATDLSSSLYDVDGTIINLIPLVFYEINIEQAYLYFGVGYGISDMELSGNVSSTTAVNIDDQYDSYLYKIELLYDNYVIELSKIDTQIDNQVEINQTHLKLGYLISF